MKIPIPAGIDSVSVIRKEMIRLRNDLLLSEKFDAEKAVIFSYVIEWLYWTEKKVEEQNKEA